MAGLQRSAQTFRRSGSSGLVWDERFLTDGGGGAPLRSGPRRQPELRHSRSVGSVGGVPRRGEAENGDKKRTKLVVAAKQKQKDQQEEEEKLVPGTGRKAFRSRDVAPAAEPPSPRVPAGCCAPCAILRGSGGASALARGAKAQEAVAVGETNHHQSPRINCNKLLNKNLERQIVEVTRSES